MRLFISHISEESKVALILKEWIESSFVGQCDVFVSSDKDDIPAGSKWIDEIDRALENAKACIVLCSPLSLTRPWINFETGCGWIKRVPIIPICHSGQKKGSLPPPISMFQALEMEDEAFIDDLLSSLAKHLGFSKIPRIDQNSMKKDILSAASLPMQDKRANHNKPYEDMDEQLPPEALEILKVLSTISSRKPTARDLAGHFNMPEQRMQYFLDLLIDGHLIYQGLYMGSPSTYSLNKQGRKHLVDRRLL